MFIVCVVTVVSGPLVAHWTMRQRTLESMVERASPALVATVLGLMAFAIVISQGAGSAFIYFQF